MMLRFKIKKFATRRDSAHARAKRQDREVKLTKVSAHAEQKMPVRRTGKVRIGARIKKKARSTADHPRVNGGGLRRTLAPPKNLHLAGAAATFPPKPRTAQGRHEWPLSGSERVVGVIF